MIPNLSEYTQYVCGFLFNDERDHVALVLKNRPAFQKGKLNGIGGHVEPGEHQDAAMVREFEEETGVCITTWKHYSTIVNHNKKYIVYFYKAFHSEAIKAVKTTTDEEICTVPVSIIHTPATMSNLVWLVALAFDDTVQEAVIIDSGNN